MYLRKYGAAATVNFPLVKRGVVDFATSSDYTHASGDTKIKKDEGASANSTNAPAHEGEGVWSLALTATEMEAARVVITVVDSATKAVEDQCVVIETYGHASAQHAFDLDTAIQQVDVETIKTQTVTCAAGVTVLASVGTAATSTAQTGDAFARLGAPAGASLAADVAAVKVDTAAILDDTGTSGVVVAAGSKTGYTLTATTGLGNQTADITGSLSGSVGSVTGAVGSVTGNVGGNVTGSVGSVATGGIAAASFAAGAVDAAALAADAAAEIADAVWDEALAGHLSAGSTGEALNAAGAAGDPWTTTLPGAYGAGSAGYIVGTNLNATVSSRSSHSAADVWAVATRVLTAGTNIALAKGVGVTGFNDLSAAQVNAEVDTALADYDAPTKAEMDAAFTEIKGATWSSVTDTLEAIRDRGDAAWTTAVGFSTHTAADVWAVASRTLTAFAFSVTVSGTPDVNVTQVAGVTVGGTGVEGDPWGPA